MTKVKECMTARPDHYGGPLVIEEEHLTVLPLFSVTFVTGHFDPVRVSSLTI